jgi:hypothetical protein
MMEAAEIGPMLSFIVVAESFPQLLFSLFLFTDQPVALLRALTTKRSISALAFAVLPVARGIRRIFFSQFFLRLCQIVSWWSGS